MEFRDLNGYYDELVSLRRHIHKNPEPSFHETETTNYICRYLDKFNIDYKRLPNTGLIARIDTGVPGKCVAFRADIDALKIEEDCSDGRTYGSVNKGVMHACGHDSHTAILMIAARYVKEHISQFKGKIVMIFQPAEELPPGGAIDILNGHFLDDLGIDEIYALHCDPTVPLGKILIVKGVLMAAVDNFEIEVIGKGGHAASPQKTIDAIAMAAHIVTQINTIRSRNTKPTEPALISIGSICGGNNFNVVAERVTIGGTVRTFSEDTRTFIEDRIKSIVAHTTGMYGGTFKINYLKGYPTVKNDMEAIEKVERVAAGLLGRENCLERKEPDMGGDDFAYYLQRIKGAMFYYGTNPTGEAVPPLHNCRFDLDEKAMLTGVEMLLGLIKEQE